MRQRRGVQWLYGELPTLVSIGVLSADAAARLQQHYGAVDTQRRHSLALLICSVLGAILIGLGIILLLAHNWQDLSRPVRTVLAFLPLVSGQGLTLWAMCSRSTSTARREGAAVFLIMSIGASIALVSQTYHVPGDLATFGLTWILLSMPLIYLVPASIAAALVWIGLTAWTGVAQTSWGQAALFWPLAVVPVPHLWMAWRQQPHGLRVVLLSWVLVVCVSIAMGTALEHRLPGLWMVIYSSLFAIFVLLDSLWLGGAPGFWHSPWHVVGEGGVVVVAWLATYTGLWDDVRGWGALRHGWQHQTWLILVDYGWALALLGLVVILLVVAIRRRLLDNVAFAVAALVIAVAFGLTASGVPSGMAAVLGNLYFLALGILTLWQGLQQGRLGTVNGGLLLILLLIAGRFFDLHLSFTVRGVVFILLGSAFLGTNVVMKRRGFGQ